MDKKTNKDRSEKAPPYENKHLTKTLSENVATIGEIFKDVEIVQYKFLKSNYRNDLQYCLVFSEGVVDVTIVNNNIIRPLAQTPVPAACPDIVDMLMTKVLQINDIKCTDRWNEIIEAIADGDSVLLIEEVEQVLILNTKSLHTRAISEPDNEKNISGPREGFTESIMLNLSLLRRRVRTPDLKMRFLTFGKRTQTRACVCYFGELVNDGILQELYRRLEKIDIDAALDTNYLYEQMRDSPATPFRTMGFTEKPDTVLGKLLEGRIAILLDGTPKVLTLPYLFIENFQSGEDYYLNYYYTSFSRLIRIIGFFLTTSVPGLYIAIVAFHHEMIPSQLLISIAVERQSVPLPAVLEMLLMLIVFDILKEAGIRMPTSIGQALSIVGALVIGQAAVEAKLIAAPMIVLVGLTGITGLLVTSTGAAVIYVRFFLLLLSSLFGFLGFASGLAIVSIHIINLRSFGVPQLMLQGDLKYQEIKDTFMRAPWNKMLLRPVFSKDRIRENNERQNKTQ